MKVWDDNWLDGAEACEHGLTLWENPNPEHTHAFEQWRAGWQAVDFDDRAKEQFQIMETGYAQYTATH